MKSAKSNNPFNLTPHHPTEPNYRKPRLVMNSFFDFANHTEVKQLLWRWLEVTVTGNFNKTLSCRERENIVHFYSQLDQFLEAVFMLHGPKKDVAREER